MWLRLNLGSFDVALRIHNPDPEEDLDPGGPLHWRKVDFVVNWKDQMKLEWMAEKLLLEEEIHQLCDLLTRPFSSRSCEVERVLAKCGRFAWVVDEDVSRDDPCTDCLENIESCPLALDLMILFPDLRNLEEYSDNILTLAFRHESLDWLSLYLQLAAGRIAHNHPDVQKALQSQIFMYEN